MFYRQCEHLRGHGLTQVYLYYYRPQYFLPPMVNQNGMYAIHPPPGFMFMTLDCGLSAFASQRAVYPPSTASAWPVTKLAKGLHSQRTAAAISSGRPSRPIGWSLTISSMVSASLAIMSSDHVSNHWRLDGSRAHGIDANASGGIFKRGTLRQTDHSMLGGMVGGTARD